MSVRVTQWAYGHDLKPGAFVVLLALADEADSDGCCYTGNAKLAWKANVSPRTLVRHLNELREMGLLHTERRAPEFGRGRALNTIVLHLEQQGTKQPFPGQRALDQRKAENRRRYEVDPEALEGDSTPVDNQAEDQGAKVALRSIPAGQAVSANLAPRSFKVPNQDVQSAKSGNETSGALRGTRARLTRQSVPSGPEELSTDDGRTDDVASPVVAHGVALDQLRQRVSGALDGVPDEVVARIVKIVLERASSPVKSRLPFVAMCVRQEPEVLVSEAESALEWEAGFATGGAATAETQEPVRAKTCPIHHTDYVRFCSGCRADALTAGDEQPAQHQADQDQPWPDWGWAQ